MTLPAYFYFTDEHRGRDPLEMATHLPSDIGIVFRHYKHSKRTELAENLVDICRRQDRYVFIAGDPDLASQTGADGCHLPSYKIAAAPMIRTRYPALNLSAACHSVLQLRGAASAGVDLAYLSPLYPTQSHPGAPALRPLSIAADIRRLDIPIYALGGINWTRWRQLRALGFSGFGAIDLFETDGLF